MMNEQKKRIDYTVRAGASVQQVVDSLAEQLKRRGFGVLSNIDVKKIIKEKLGEDMSSYVILDVCSPRHAKKAIDAHKEVGLLLPCKITVYEDSGAVWVSLYKPTEALKVLDAVDLSPLALEVERELKAAVDSAVA